MGHDYSKKVQFKCWDDCQPNGCPGHTMQADYSRGSDVASFLKDGKPIFYADPNLWAAMREAALEVKL